MTREAMAGSVRNGQGNEEGGRIIARLINELQH